MHVNRAQRFDYEKNKKLKLILDARPHATIKCVEICQIKNQLYKQSKFNLKKWKKLIQNYSTKFNERSYLKIIKANKINVLFITHISTILRKDKKKNWNECYDVRTMMVNEKMQQNNTFLTMKCCFRFFFCFFFFLQFVWANKKKK